EDERERNRWMSSISVDLPSQMEWRIICMLYKNPMRQYELVGGLDVSNRTEVAPVLAGMVGKGLLSRKNNNSPYELTDACRSKYLDFDPSKIGTATDIPEVVEKVVDAYISRRMFLAVAPQRVKKGEDRTDLVAYDYDNENPISIEVESESEVQSHPEHVKYNMKKWHKMGFKECHVWSKSSRIRQIRDTLQEEERKGVMIVVTSS
ncbi:MAG: hypothetical protein MPK30_09655, partial [Gammaproteobacteria bacterium]|nr:hypothetical protein [Gammaproteobacteria bacterium]